MKTFLILTFAALISHTAFAQSECVNISGCYLNTKESSGKMQSLIKASSGCWGAQYTIGKVFSTGTDLLTLPDRAALDYRVSSEFQKLPKGMGKFKITVDSTTVQRNEFVSSPPRPDYEVVIRNKVVEAGDQACGQTAIVRTLVEESQLAGYPTETSCEAYPSVEPQQCAALVAYTSNKAIARCEGSGTIHSSSGSKTFTYKAYLVENGVGRISTRVFRESPTAEFSIEVYEPMSFRAEVDPAQGLVLHLVSFSNSEWYNGYPLVLDTKNLTTNTVRSSGNAGGGPGTPFDTIQCRFTPEAFKP